MNKLAPYINEIVGLFVMLLLLVALVSGQVNARVYELASLDAGYGDPARTSHVLVEDE